MISQDQPAPRNFFIDLLRWVAALPAAFAASYLAYLVTGWAVRFGFGYAEIGPDSLWVQLWDLTFVHGAMGATFVYVGTFVIPGYKAAASVVLCLLAVAAAGVLAYFAVQASDWWALTGAISVLVGAIIMVVAIQSGQIAKFA